MNRTILCANLSLLANYGDEIGFHEDADFITQAVEEYSTNRTAGFNLMKTLGLSSVEKAMRKYWKSIFTIAAMYYGGSYIFGKVLGITDKNLIAKLLFNKKSLIETILKKKGLNATNKDDASEIAGITNIVDTMYSNANANMNGVAKKAIQSGQIPGAIPGTVGTQGALPPAGQTTTNAGLSQEMSTLSSQSVSRLKQITDTKSRKTEFDKSVMPAVNNLFSKYSTDPRANDLKNQLVQSIKFQSGVS
jgi:hypothetical protein